MQRLAVGLCPCLVMLVCLGCGGSKAADPWAETKLSREAREQAPIPLADESPVTMLKSIFSTAVFSGRPNLYDLHHPEGALATYAQRDPIRTVMLASRAGIAVEFDDQTGIATVRGQPRQLWLNLDKTPVQLPKTHYRRGIQAKPAIASVTSKNRLRYSDGEGMAVPLISAEDLSTAAAHWSTLVGLRSTAGQAPKHPAVSPDQVHSLYIPADGPLQWNRQEVPLEHLAKAVEAALQSDDRAVFVHPHAASSYGRLVQALDILQAVVEAGTPLRFALPHSELSRGGKTVGLVRRLRPAASDAPVMVLKIDREARFRDVQKLLDGLADHLDRVVLLTQLDLSEQHRITASTWPGGLPGGMPLALAKPTPQQLSEAYPGSVAGLASRNPRPASAMTPAPQQTRLPQQPQEPRIVQVGGDVKPPVKISGPDPEYTDTARQANAQGVVILQLVIDTQGRVEATKVLKGLDLGLTERAVEAVRQWRYEPAQRNGEPTAVYFNVTVPFRLEP